MKKIFVAMLALVLGASYGAADDKKAGGTAGQFADAYKIATASPPNGQLLNARVETKKDGAVVYGFYLYNRDMRLLFEREVDLKTGQLVKDTTKKLEPVQQDMADLIEKKATGKSKLPEGRLFEIAAEKLKKSEVKEVKYETVGDQLVLTVGDLQIDAETGKEIEKGKK